MEKWKRRSIDLLTALVFGGREKLSVVPYYPQKTRISGKENKHFRRTIPEKKGISSRRLYNMLCELESERRANIHGLMVLSGAEVICECYTPGYDGDTWHIAHSMSKTVCGMIIGRLYDEGKIRPDRPICEIFPEIQYKDKRFPLITVEHLLSMTSGVEFAETGSVTESNWTEAFFASPIKFSPGERFAYNSMNTYILARAAERVSGKAFRELAEEYIFAPLGIENYLWEVGPENTEKAGWGLYMTSESWAKLGVMFLSGGDFEGKRILSPEWVSLSSTVKAITPEKNGGFNYSYQTWVGRESDELLFSGMFGQNVWICPKNNIVVVMSGGNNELFAASPALEIVRKYLGGRISDKLNFRDAALLARKQDSFFEHRRWVRPLEEGSGLLCWLGLRKQRPFDDEWNGILGRYLFAGNSVGMLPLIVRAMQNNLSSNLQEISLWADGDELYLKFCESGEDYTIPIGLYNYRESKISIRGERYLVRAVGEACDAPCGREYRIELVFPETASVRRLVIKRTEKGKITLQMSETPGDRVATEYLKECSGGGGTLSFVIDLIERRFGKGVVDKTIRKTFNPTLVGADASVSGYESLVRTEEEKNSAEQSGARFIRSIVERFFREND